MTSRHFLDLCKILVFFLIVLISLSTTPSLVST
jgi:hypothetical protein